MSEDFPWAEVSSATSEMHGMEIRPLKRQRKGKDKSNCGTIQTLGKNIFWMPCGYNRWSLIQYFHCSEVEKYMLLELLSQNLLPSIKYSLAVKAD